MIDWTTRQFKSSVSRPFVWTTDRSFKNVVCLPGAQGEDLKYALKHNYINHTTQVVAVERDRLAFLSMASTIQKMPIYSKLINDDLCNVKLSGTFDMANLDYLGNMRKVDVEWFRDMLVPHLAVDAKVCITGYPALRGNTFIQALIDEFQKVSLFEEIVASQAKTFSVATRHLAAMMEIFLALWLLDGYDFEFDSKSYRDDASMAVFVCKNIRPRPTMNHPDFELLRTVIENVITHCVDEDFVPNERMKKKKDTEKFRTIAEELAHATTPDRLKRVSIKMNRYAAERAIGGKDPVMVIAGFKAAATRIRKKMK